MIRKFSPCRVLFFTFTLLSAAASLAQVAVPGDPVSRYLFLLQLKNPTLKELSYQNSAFYGRDSAEWNLWKGVFYSTPVKNEVRILDPVVRAFVNTSYPRGYNDGPVWRGKGLTVEANAGVQGNYKAFYFTFMPSVYYSQNAEFPLASVQPSIGKYNYQFATYGSIDYVQRYGERGFAKLHPGQSEVRLTGRKLTLGIGTKNISWGPSVFNPILMSKNAGGFPLADAGTSSPLSLRIKRLDLGKLYGGFYMGLLKRSDYHNSNSESAHRYLTGFSAEYEPPFVKGLKLGVSRLLYKNLNHFDWDDLVASVYQFSEGPDTLHNDYFDQLASVSVEYLISEAGLRIYTELGKNDFNGDARDFLVDFEHSFAYTLGVQKAHELASGKTLLVTYEHTKLARDKGYLHRPVPPYYVHFFSTDGYTNDGQLVGAGIGPGSLSDNLAIDWYHTNGGLGVNLRRIKFDNDFFITNYGYYVVPGQDFSNKNLQDTEYSIGMNYVRSAGQWLFGVDVDLSYRFNWHYIYKNDKINLGAALSARRLLRNK